ncbi:hypothetical protein WJX81_000677 [Elliptochloris bilobata]|uniref:Uncharacterized protein n=1 Tax=Elliptochloris bilobata TaxID=381761 RepID=A0AAW1SHG4_9CHLO
MRGGVYIHHWMQTGGCSPPTVQTILQKVAATAREHDYTPNRAEQRALTRTLGDWLQLSWASYLVFGNVLFEGWRGPTTMTLEDFALRCTRRFPAALFAGYVAWRLVGEAVSLSTLKRVLTCPDSPMANECAAILRELRPNAQLSFYKPSTPGLRISPTEALAAPEGPEAAVPRSADDVAGASGNDVAPLQAAAERRASESLYDGLFGWEEPGVVATGGAVRRGDLPAAGDSRREAEEEAALGGVRDRRRGRNEQRRARRQQGEGGGSRDAEQ